MMNEKSDVQGSSVRKRDNPDILVQFHYMNPMADIAILLNLDSQWLPNSLFTPLAPDFRPLP